MHNFIGVGVFVAGAALLWLIDWFANR